MTPKEKADELSQTWQHNGLHFGYPQCCIDSFVKRGRIIVESEFHDQPEFTENQIEATNNTGFIPCATCADRVVSGEIELKDLITNRTNSAPFPDER